MLGVGGDFKDRIGNIKDCVLGLDDIPPYEVINERSQSISKSWCLSCLIQSLQ